MDDPATSDRIHLVVLIHGLYGSPANLATVDEEVHRAGTRSTASRVAEEGYAESENEVDHLLDLSDPLPSSHSGSSSSTTLPSSSSAGAYASSTASSARDGSSRLRVVTLPLKSFTGSHTWDGIDLNGHRARTELLAEIQRLEDQGGKVKGVSIMGYSLGGLVGRYLVGLLYTTGFWNTYIPVCFSTAATPHLGVLKYQSRVNTVVHTVGRRLFSRSGQQLYNLEKYDGGRSLLEVMADPDGVFMRALKRFPRVMIVANGCHDATVPYPSAAISLTDPFDSFHNTGMEVEVDHRNILTRWSTENDTSLVSTASIPRTLKVDLREYKGIDGVMRRRPRLPPILFLPFPFTYLLVVLLPFIIPLWFIFASSIMVYHTIQSRQRHRLHLSDVGASSIGSTFGDLRDALRRSDGSRSTNGHPPFASDETAALLASLSSSAPISRNDTPPLHQLSTPLFDNITSKDSAQVDQSDEHLPRPGQIPLLLTPQQKRMVKKLNEGLPQMERIIGWFPWAFNAHALLVVRDRKRFPWHEEGRGVVRAWAEYVVESSRVAGLEADQ